MFSVLNVLVIGLGSMGKRRIRNLKANGVLHISGVDPKKERRSEAALMYDIPTYGSTDDLALTIFDALIISVPPDLHHIYLKLALKHGVPAFVEASVVDTDMTEIIRERSQSGVFIAPSSTLYFHPAIQLIGRILSEKKIGMITNIIYHSGQYLPDWHSYEKVSEYYVSKKETGGAREIVPFELTWLTHHFGFPKRATGFVKKTIDIEGADEIDDTYNLLLDYPGYILNLSVDVVSRKAVRRLFINASDGQLVWDWDENMIKLYRTETGEWENILYDVAGAHSGYNKNITETMYNEEIKAFLTSVIGKGSFPNTLENDFKVLQLLYATEKCSETNFIQFIA